MSAITFDYTTTTDEIKARLDITDIIGEYVNLTRRGRDWWGLCPLHDEKTPSFSVSPGKQIFHCFGCNQGGDIFDFIMKYHNTDFKAARDLLAARAGISTGMDRETWRHIQAAQRKREREKVMARKLEQVVNAEIERLTNIEKWCYLIINTICTEQCLDRPAVIWALTTRDRVGYLLDQLQQGDARQQLSIVNETRRWGAWNI